MCGKRDAAVKSLVVWMRISLLLLFPCTRDLKRTLQLLLDPDHHSHSHLATRYKTSTNLATSPFQIQSNNNRKSSLQVSRDLQAYQGLPLLSPSIKLYRTPNHRTLLIVVDRRRLRLPPRAVLSQRPPKKKSLTPTQLMLKLTLRRNGHRGDSSRRSNSNNNHRRLESI